MRSLVREDIKSRTTDFATSIRFGLISSASIESDISKTIMISWGILFLLVVCRVILIHIRIKNSRITSIDRVTQRKYIIFGFLRYFAIRGFGYIDQNFSRKNTYQIERTIGIKKRTMGYEKDIMNYDESFLSRLCCICSIIAGSGIFPENSIFSSCSIIAMSSSSIVYDRISIGICAQLCIG